MNATKSKESLTKAINFISDNDPDVWEQLANNLESDQSTIQIAKRKAPQEIQEQCRQFLHGWWQEVGREASVDKLCTALSAIKRNKTRHDLEDYLGITPMLEGKGVKRRRMGQSEDDRTVTPDEPKELLTVKNKYFLQTEPILDGFSSYLTSKKGEEAFKWEAIAKFGGTVQEVRKGCVETDADFTDAELLEDLHDSVALVIQYSNLFVTDEMKEAAGFKPEDNVIVIPTMNERKYQNVLQHLKKPERRYHSDSELPPRNQEGKLAYHLKKYGRALRNAEYNLSNEKQLTKQLHSKISELEGRERGLQTKLQIATETLNDGKQEYANHIEILKQELTEQKEKLTKMEKYAWDNRSRVVDLQEQVKVISGDRDQIQSKYDELQDHIGELKLAAISEEKKQAPDLTERQLVEDDVDAAKKLLSDVHPSLSVVHPSLSDVHPSLSDVHPKDSDSDEVETSKSLRSRVNVDKDQDDHSHVGQSKDDIKTKEILPSDASIKNASQVWEFKAARKGAMALATWGEQIIVSSHDSHKLRMLTSTGKQTAPSVTLSGCTKISDVTKFDNLLYVVSDDNERNEVYVCDPATGTIVREIQIGGATKCGPTGIRIDSKKRMIVSDWRSNRVYVYTLTGKLLAKIPPEGSKARLDEPHGMCLTKNDDIILTNLKGSNVMSFSREGEHLWTYGPGRHGNKRLNCPRGVCTDRSGNILVADYLNNRVVVLTSGGLFEQILLTGEDGVGSPVALGVDDRDQLLVGQGDGIVKIFKLQY